MSDYELTDSDYDYDENEKILLETARKGPEQDSEEEVLNVLSSGEDSFEEDIEDFKDDLPSSKAWGQRKKNYYNTDYVDEDFGGFQGEDAERAEFEEQEARAIQERLLKEIDESDYMVDAFKLKLTSQDEKVEEKIETDISGLSKREKLALFAKESPEFAGLVNDFKVKIQECDEKLFPVLKLINKGDIPKFPICKLIKTKYDLSMSYCTNILYYLLLKARRVAVYSHPVIKRLNQHRQLLKELEKFDKTIAPQIDLVLEKIKNGEELKFDSTKDARPVKELKIVEKVPSEGGSSDERFMDKNTSVMEEGSSSQESDEESNQRRSITYQIAKNKGLTPYRKKELRNPRVKHRIKYQKAKIRRKGQVREPRKELQKYGGEISGIKIGISKSIKFK